jgi:outer membrane protein assembly factor BamB
VQDIPIDLDNELGFKHIGIYNDICITVVYREKRSDDEFNTGDPDHATLVAYDLSGEKWSYKLLGWSLSINYGGFYIINDKVIFNEETEKGIKAIALDINTGQKILENPSKQFLDTSHNQKDKTLSLSYDNIIVYAIYENGFYLRKINKNIEDKLLLEKNPNHMAQNKEYLFFYCWDHEGAKLILLNKHTEQVTKEVKLSTEEIISMHPSNDGNYIIFNQENSNKISCFKIEEERIIWTMDTTDEGVSFQAFNVKLDQNDFVHVFCEYPEESIRILNIASGDKIQEIVGEEDIFITPIFTINDKLFIQDFSNFYCYEQQN